MNIVDFSLKRRVTVAMAAIAVSLFGAVAFGRLPVNLLPDISYPSLTVETRLPGAAPGEVETLVTRPIEEAVGIVGGVERLTSVSRPGLSQVTLELGWGRDMDFAALDVRQKLDLVTLPRQVETPVLLRFDPANEPVLRLYLSGGGDLFQLRYLAEEVLKKDLESTEGLAAVKVHGGFEEEIQVEVDEGKLALMGLGIGDVRDRLARENVNQAGGSLYEEEARYLVRSRNEFEDLGDILGTVLFAEGGRVVTLGEVATVTRGARRREVVTRFGGEEAVELALYKEGDANTVAVARAVEARLERLRGELPEGVTLASGADQSRFIQASIREVLSNALVGGAVAVVLLLLFLKDLRSTVIIAVSIPLSIVATFFLMYRTGTTLNVMSLGGLALGVGMLVDNAIVVLEAIQRRREEGDSPLEAARRGASEVGRAVAASTLTTVAVFLPVVFLEGVAAQLFRDQALTVSFSLIASLAVSLTLIPMLAALAGGRRPGATLEPLEGRPASQTGGAPRRFARLPAVVLRFLRRLGRGGVRGAAWVVSPLSRVFDAVLGWVTGLYPRLLSRALAHRALVLAVAVAALALAAAWLPRLGLDLIPTLRQGEFAFRVELPEGTPLASTDRYLASVEEVLAGDSRVESFSSTSGGAGLSLTRTGTEGENIGRIQVRLAPGATAEDEEAVVAALRTRLEGEEAARFKLERPSVFTLRTPVEVEVYGDRLPELHEAAETLRGRMEEIPGLVDVKSSAEMGSPEVRVTFHREQLMRLGLDLSQVAAVVRNKVQGDVATRFSEGDREIDILVRSAEGGRISVEELGSLIVGRRAGAGPGVPIRLAAVADLEIADGPAEIRRAGQKRVALVSGNLAGRDMRSVAADVRQVLSGDRAARLPLGVTAVLGGQQEEMARSLGSMLLAIALAVFLVYLVMASQFESFLHPFVILFTLPLGAVGVVAALALAGQTVNVVALIGVVMLAGIVVNNAIVLIDAVNRLRREEGLPRTEALIEAGRRRLRPILMTSATTICGLAPMALGLGEGAELRAPLAITVIGGLAVATALTLVVIPVVYSLLDRQRLPADEAAEARSPAAEAVLAGPAEAVS
jgi:HAE1 family hydrophobic/amphiphilic exporter-1